MELFARDVQAGLDAAVADKRQELVRFIEGLWNKYRVTLGDLRGSWCDSEVKLRDAFQNLGYA